MTSGKKEKQEKQKEFKEGFTYLYMKKGYQEFFGWALLISGILLILSIFAPPILQNKPISLSQTNWISIIIGCIIIYIGYKGTRGKW